MTDKENGLEMARKRDRKVMITKEAIEKVPYIRYREIPEEHYEVLHTLAREVLLASRDRNGSNEVAITYRLDSRELLEQGQQYIGIAYGDEHSVTVKAVVGGYAISAEILFFENDSCGY